MFDNFFKKSLNKKTFTLPDGTIPTVEDIHAEFDAAQDQFLESADNLLKELSIPTQTHIEKKADMLKSLGFVNSETIKKAEEIKKTTESIRATYEMTERKANLIKYYKIKYPLEKFIPVEELNRICRKYNLIHAPAKNYIKDIPEKNVIEMSNRKTLSSSDEVEKRMYLKIDRFYSEAPSDVRRMLNGEIQIPTNLLDSFSRGRVSESSCMKLLKYLGYTGTYSGYIYFDASIKTVDESGLRVAAPNSHFDLTGIEKTSEFGYGYKTVQIMEIKDPVVFEYCKGDICRIITKWGTDDDQSYLDPALTNEIQN